ncbi:MAG TPA: hypothetical protein DIT67_14385, partial [Octadecabacter sp.]|nr:hypothetical protein [Octadecabacter sp.]
FAAADWSPRPAMFSYDATFENCKANPDTGNLAASCEGEITGAYVLKRAVAWAAFKCFPESFATCALPFEDEGLPAIAARIAVDAGCDATNVLDLPEDEPLPADHCISIASDIMIDEGVVPLNTDVSCGIHWIECGDITLINASFWADQVDRITQNDPEFANDLQTRNREDCAQEAREIGNRAVLRDGLICEAERSAALWSDLTVQSSQDQ